MSDNPRVQGHPIDLDLAARHRRARAVLQRRRAVARQRLALRTRSRNM